MTESSEQQESAVREFFGRDAESYDARHYRAGRATFISDRLEAVRDEFQHARIPRGGTVVDVACGPGQFLAIASAAGMRAVGIDRSPDMLRVTRSRLGDNVELHEADASALPLQRGSVDLVNCSGLIEYLPDPRSVLQEFARVLRPGGRVLVSSTNRLSPAFALGAIENRARRSAFARRLSELLRLDVPASAWKTREFEFHFHTAIELSQYLQHAGFTEVRVRQFHLQFMPHPADRVLPQIASLSAKLARPLLRTRLGRRWAEGLLGVATRPARASE